MTAAVVAVDRGADGAARAVTLSVDTLLDELAARADARELRRVIEEHLTTHGWPWSRIASEVIDRLLVVEEGEP